MTISLAQRIRELPPYLFAKIDELKREQRKKGADVIDLGVGDPDLPTPAHIVASLQRAATEARFHQYPSYAGMLETRQAIAHHYMERFGVRLDPATEALVLIGSKEGIAHFPLAVIDPGDVVLVPDPGYPVYATGASFAGAEVTYVPLLRANGFLPDLAAIPESLARRAKLLWLNYPNNPTAALAPLSFYERAVAWAKTYGVILASDLAYSEMYYDEADRPVSLLAVDGAKDVAIEFHSLSKTYNMTGWRLGFAVGNATLVKGLGQVKTNVDSGAFGAVQQAAIDALGGDQSCVAKMRDIYRERRDVLCGGLARAGYDVLVPKASFYCLVAVPAGFSSLEFATKLLEENGIVSTPANGFGAHGEGFVRFTLCADKARLAEAVRRIAAGQA